MFETVVNMKPITELSECLKDSPKFRMALEESEEDIEVLELKLDKMVKCCTAMVDVGKTYVNAKISFVNTIVDLSTYFKQDGTVSSTLNRLIQALHEMVKYHTILIDQAHRSICKNLNSFVKNDIRGVKDTKRYFEKISDDLDQALIRNSQVSRSKPHESEEAVNVLTATRSCFQHTGLDYVNQISLLQSKKRHEVLDTLLSYMHAQTTYIHQGSDLCQDTDPLMKEIADNLTKMRSETLDLEKQLEGRHSLVQSKEIVPNINFRGSLNGMQIEGYLFKRTSNAFKTWNRRWFSIQKGQLVYRKRSKDDMTVMEEDLRLCSVKASPEIDRRFCFEVISPTKNHMLQADSEEMYNMWVAAMQAGINAAIQRATFDGDDEEEETNKDQPSNSKSNDSSSEDLQQGDNKKIRNSSASPKSLTTGGSAMQQILCIPGNDKCCDCKSPHPRWASINLGITLCIECSGIHRSLGVHHSKVRSLNLDAWEGELVKIMVELGNDVVNGIYEADIDANPSVTPATPDCVRNIRESWIKAKYIQKAFIRRADPGRRPSPKQHLRRQWNVRKLSVNVRPRSNIPTDDPTLLALQTSKRSPSLNPDINRKRSGGFFPELEPINLLEAAKDGNESKNEGEEIVVQETVSETSIAKEENVGNEILVEGKIEDAPSEKSGDEFQEDKEGSIEDFSDFYDDLDDEEYERNPNLMLHRGALSPNIPMMCEALALGADLNWVNIEDEGKTAIHQAIGSGTVLACEFLFLNGAKNNGTDGEGRTPLHLATELGNTGQVCLLLKRGADQHAVDNKGRNALSVAVENANADIVTLLRIAKLNDEMRESSEYGNNDETFNEVVKDFSKLASDNPERLKRSLSSDTTLSKEY